jgi:hypothetical protein
VALCLEQSFKRVLDVSREPNEIVFGFVAGLVPRQEVANAAKKYCGYNGRDAALEGYSRRCIRLDPQDPRHIGRRMNEKPPNRQKQGSTIPECVRY